MVAADGLAPVWRQDICIHHVDVGQCFVVKNVPICLYMFIYISIQGEGSDEFNVSVIYTQQI